MTVVALVAMALPASALAARQGAGTCSNGWMQAGTYHGFTVTGTCMIAYGANVQINGNLTIKPGAALDDHGAEAWMNAQIHVTGNIYVGKGAVLGLGWNGGGPLGGEGAWDRIRWAGTSSPTSRWHSRSARSPLVAT